MKKLIFLLVGCSVCFATSLAQNANQDSLIVTQKYRWSFLDSMARQVHSIDNVDSSLHYFQLMEDYANATNSRKKLRKTLIRRGTMLVSAGLFKEAIPVYQRALKVCDPEKDLSLLSVVHRKLAYAYRKTGSISQSLSHYQLAIDNGILAEDKAPLTLANAYNSRGNAFLNLLEFDLAEADYLKAQSTYEALGSQQGIAASYNNLSLIYIRQKAYEKAIPYLEKSLALKQSIDDQRGIANVYANLGDIAYEQQQYAEAKAYHEQSIAIRDALNLQEDVTQSYTRMGEIALANDQLQKAIFWCEKSCAIADAGQYWEARSSCHYCLHQAHQQLENWEQSLVELKISQTIQDSINRQNKAEDIRLQAARAEFETALAQAKQENEVLVTETRREQLVIWTLLFLIAAAIIYFMLRRSSPADKPVSPTPAIEPSQVVSPPNTPHPEAESEVVQWLEQLRQHIEEMIEKQQEITISAIANHHHLSERQLLRRIKEQTGFTTSQYVREVRLLLAKRWIEQRQFSKIKDVAEAAGFKSYAHFSELFTKRFGQSPRAFLQ